MPRKRKITLEQVDVLGDDRAYFDVWGVFVYDNGSAETLYVTNDQYAATKLYLLAAGPWSKLPVKELKKRIGEAADKYIEKWRGGHECEC